jgi:hypothetical protein
VLNFTSRRRFNSRARICKFKKFSKGYTRTPLKGGEEGKERRAGKYKGYRKNWEMGMRRKGGAQRNWKEGEWKGMGRRNRTVFSPLMPKIAAILSHKLTNINDTLLKMTLPTTVQIL